MLTATSKYYARIIKPYNSVDEFIDTNGYREFYNVLYNLYHEHSTSPSVSLTIDDDGYELIVVATYSNEAEYDNLSTAIQNAAQYLYDGDGPEYAPIFSEEIAIVES